MKRPSDFRKTALARVNHQGALRSAALVLLTLAAFALLGISLYPLAGDAGEKNAAPGTSGLQQYESSIDYSCRGDEDCAIKDVHNCCGLYPVCVNVKAKVDPALVEDLCRREGVVSICGFPAIESCRCDQGRCAGVSARLPQGFRRMDAQ